MHHLKLIKGLSYDGAVSATKACPDVFVDDEVKYMSALKSGYFKEIAEEQASEENTEVSSDAIEYSDSDMKENTVSDELSGMSVDELRAYAELGGIDLAGARKKDDILKAIKAAEERAAEARQSIR